MLPEVEPLPEFEPLLPELVPISPEPELLPVVPELLSVPLEDLFL